MQFRPGAFRTYGIWLPAVAIMAIGVVALGTRADAFDGSGQKETITVTVTADAITVSPATVRPGEATFRVMNRTSAVYDVDIDGPGPDGEIENIPAGATRTMTMMLRAGRYTVEADPENGGHERKAMLTVKQ